MKDRRYIQRFTSDFLAIIEMCPSPFFLKIKVAGGRGATKDTGINSDASLTEKKKRNLLYRSPHLSGKLMPFLSFLAEGKQIYQRKVCTPHPASF